MTPAREPRSNGRDGDPQRAAAATDPPRSVEEALRRAGQHARAALAESIAALRALLDAASLAAAGVPSDEQRRLARLAAGLDALHRQLAAGDAATPLLEAVAEALDEEIARWEERSREDPEARPVLRAFLGLREILWELGVRRSREPREAGRSRVQRVPVES